MASYAELRLGSFYLGGDRKEINPLIMTLFRASDKRVERILAGSERAAEYLDSAEFDDQDAMAIVRYECPASAARDRLELMGFTLGTAKAAFEAGIRHRSGRERHFGGPGAEEYFAEERAVLSILTAELWIEQLKRIRARRMRIRYSGDRTCRRLSPVLRYMLCTHGVSWYGFPGYDIRHMIRLALEACGTSDTLSYDLTDLVLRGYYDTDTDLVEHADYLLSEDFEISQRVIVLTEGATDKWIIESTLRALYPHLADYFSFMDFDGARVAGGAGALAGIVKSFVGAGILNRVLALFDNDTAARAALRSLAGIELPKNVVVQQFPAITIAENYPTLGPSGIVRMNVNGMAGSIELYLGNDVLRGNDGGLAPIQWRGYDDAVGQYQGEIVNKRVLHQRFREKLARWQERPEPSDECDWDGMRAIIAQMTSAFHPADAADLIEFEERGV